MKTISTPAIIEGISSKKDGSLGLRVSTPELRPEEKTLFFELQGVNLDIKITPTDEKGVEEVVIDTDLEQKSQSQRIRNTLFIIWKQNPGGKEFADFYKEKTEKYIEYLKGKIE